MWPSRARPIVAALAALTALASCGLEVGDRFGRAAADPGRLRIHLLDDVRELDPARARTELERSVARQLFSPLVDVGADGHPEPSLASSWEVRGGRLVMHLRDARIENGDPLTAGDVVWSWRRALRPSTGAADLAPLGTITGGAALAHGTLLRIGRESVHGAPPPYAVFREGAGEAVRDDELTEGTAVRVLDTNTREVCCGAPVQLRRTAGDAGAGFDALAPGEVGVVVGIREIGKKVFVQLRAPSGSAGWALAGDLKMYVPAIGLVHVVDRGGHSPTLRSGPDEDAPPRAVLMDDDVVEMVERGVDRCWVIDTRTGESGWLDSKNIDETVRVRRWFLVEAVTGGERGWVQEQDLAFDPGLLDVVALDDHTLEIGLAVDVDHALAAFAAPVLRPVPPRLVEASGRAWTAPGTMLTTGPFKLVAHAPDESIELALSATSFEAPRARVEHVELLVIKNKTTALHLYRAGMIDALLDGALPPDLAPTLARASDFLVAPLGGALVALEVRGLSPVPLELRDVSVTR